jgi:hypothetical protein
MNILILCIFNETDRNKELIQIQRNNFIKNDLMDYYFITYDKSLTREFKLMKDTLFIKGSESHLNILDKTIKSLRYFTSNKNYYFIVRTNISTAFNYKLLYNYLNEIPRNNIYIGGNLYKLVWLDPRSGVTKENTQKYSLNDLFFFQGTCIILSRDVVKFILDNSNNLKYDIVDDVSIGLFIKTYLPNAYLKYTNMPKISRVLKDKKIYNINSVLYRHKSYNDNEDIKNMIDTFKIIHNQPT